MGGITKVITQETLKRIVETRYTKHKQ